MDTTELILICLVAVALLAIVARKISVPYPILLTVAGGGLALVPGLPVIHLEPKLVFDLFLPPLLYPAAVYTSWRDFRANLRSILPLATFFVLLTMGAIACLFHALTGLPLAVGFVFGALISPPDAVAALAVTQNLKVPRKIVVILEGESLVNDATSFISFRFAVAAVLTGTFSLGEASLEFLLVAAGGIGVGLATGWLATQVQKRLDDPPVQTMFSLLTPYVAYFCGETLHVSGILAVVIAGIFYGWRAPRVLSGRMRLQAIPVWQMVTFILNGILFMLIGLQLPQVIHALPPGSAMAVAKLAHPRPRWRSCWFVLSGCSAPLICRDSSAARSVAKTPRPGNKRPLSPGPGCAARIRWPARSRFHLFSRTARHSPGATSSCSLRSVLFSERSSRKDSLLSRSLAG